MNVSFQRVNPHGGQQSVLLRFNTPSSGYTPCILVDAGPRLSLDAVLGDQDYLLGVLLTHTHRDHYTNLTETLTDSAPIYTTPETTSFLPALLQEAKKTQEFTHNDVQQILRETTPISTWTDLNDSIQVTPITVGHAVGACGFIIQFPLDNGESGHILITGDFTKHSVCGYEGIKHSYPVSIDVVFLNTPTATQAESHTTAAITDILNALRTHKRALVVANPLTILQHTYILTHYLEQQQADTDVFIVGQAAKFAEALDISLPNTTTLPDFSSSTFFSPSSVCFAAPDVPSTGSSNSVYNALSNHGHGTLIQIRPPNRPMIEPDQTPLTVKTHTYSSHPTQQQIDILCRHLRPIHLIALHGNDQSYRDKYTFSYTWANDQPREFTLYADGEWNSPEWVSENMDAVIQANNPYLSSDKNRTSPSQDRNPPLIDVQSRGETAAMPVYSQSPPSLSKEAVSVQDLPQVDPVSTEHHSNQPEEQNENSSGRETEKNTWKADVDVIETADGALLLRVTDGELPLSDGDHVPIQYSDSF